MANTKIQRIKTISEYHRLRGLPKPEHPLISLINFEKISYVPEAELTSWIMDFYPMP